MIDKIVNNVSNSIMETKKSPVDMFTLIRQIVKIKLSGLSEYTDKSEGKRKIKPEVITSVSAGVINGAQRLGKSILDAAEATVYQTIITTYEIGGDLSITLDRATSGLIRATKQVEGDLSAMARAIIKGSIKGSRKIGISTYTPIKIALISIIDTSQEISDKKSVERIKNVLLSTPSLPNDVIEKAIKEFDNKSEV